MPYRLLFRASLLAVLAVAALAGARVQASASLVLDNFDDGSIDQGTWQVTTSGGFTGVSETNGQLVFTHGDRNELQSGFASLSSKCKLSGDFDIFFDYELLEWPAANNTARITLFASPLFAMERLPTDYLANLGAGATIIPTSDTSGSFRIVREGDVATAFYFQGSDWVVAATRSGVSTADVTFNIQSGVDNIADPPNIVVAADNAGIDKATLACYKNGDVDCDGHVTAFDGLDVALAEGGTPTEWPNCPDIGTGILQPASAGPTIFGDVDCNDSADAADLLPILRFVAGLPPETPGGCTPVDAPIQVSVSQ